MSMEKTRKNCILCGAPLMKEPIYECKNMPATAQNLPSKKELKKDLPEQFNLCQCSGCGLIQFDCAPVSYYKDSTRAGERCEALIKLRQNQYSHLIEKYHLEGKKIIEIGAGKGGFLKTLKEMKEYKIQEFGIESNQEFAKIAREKEGVNVMQGDSEDAGLCIKGGPFDAFVSFAYPARLVNPNGMMQQISNNTTDDAVGLIQVPSFEHLVKPGGFYDITRDHIAYYDEDTLRFLLQKNGFDVIEHGEVSQLYIYAIAKKRKSYNLRKAWADVELLAESVRRFIHNRTKGDKKVAVWCAGHFAFTVLSTTGIGDKISYIIDNAKFKQNCYAPASHVRIVGPEHYREEPVDTILILGPIYVDEIVDEIREKCSPDVDIATMDKSGMNIVT